MIASSSLRDGGVRRKTAILDPLSWQIIDVPQWDEVTSDAWFIKHTGDKYDWRGALSTVLPGSAKEGEWFCNEAVGASVGLLAPETFDPATFAAIVLTLGTDVTAEFFAKIKDAS